MALILLRRSTALNSSVNSCFLSRVYRFSSRVSTILDNDSEETRFTSVESNRLPSRNNGGTKFPFSPTLSNIGAQEKDYNIELVDNETWRISSGLAEAWKSKAEPLGKNAANEYINPKNEDPDFDEIEDMRIRGNLFYKLDKDSKEFEEYNFDFHRKKSWKKNKHDQTQNKSNENPDRKLASRAEKHSTYDQQESKKENSRRLTELDLDNLVASMKDCGEKKQRTLTFNQLTAPYHEPFCLDIYISKASVRACIIHRATSNVVAVAHSISKDMKFDLGSTKNGAACVAVGQILAQRALADDIHNVVYTPRKGERLEGKLQTVLQSIIDNGIDVKVKIKQRKFKRSGLPSRA